MAEQASAHLLFRLQNLQIQILDRIGYLEQAILVSSLTNHASNPMPQEPPDSDLSMEKKLGKIMREAGVNSYKFKRVPRDYYERTFEERRDLLGAASVDHLCKSIVMVNTQAHESVKDCSDRNNSKYYLVIVQYTARFNAEKVKQYVCGLNDGKIPKKRFNMRLAPEDEAYRLTGFSHNAVTPFGMKSQIPIILSNAIPKLQPEYFWLGGGEVDLKLGIHTREFIKIFTPFIADCS